MGKFVFFPFIYKEAVRRTNKNIFARTLETKVIINVTKDVIHNCLIEKFLSVVRAKWPKGCSRTLFIQQDNARPNINVNDVDFFGENSKDRFDVLLCF